MPSLITKAKFNILYLTDYIFSKWNAGREAGGHSALFVLFGAMKGMSGANFNKGLIRLN